MATTAVINICRYGIHICSTVYGMRDFGIHFANWCAESVSRWIYHNVVLYNKPKIWYSKFSYNMSQAHGTCYFNLPSQSPLLRIKPAHAFPKFPYLARTVFVCILSKTWNSSWATIIIMKFIYRMHTKLDAQHRGISLRNYTNKLSGIVVDVYAAWQSFCWLRHLCVRFTCQLNVLGCVLFLNNN